MPSKKETNKEKPLLELSMDRDIMYEVIRAVTTFSAHDLRPIRAEVYRHGLVLICGDASQVSMMTVALGKKVFKSYTARESTYINLSDEDLKDVKTLIRAATEKGNLPLELTFDPPNNLRANIGTLKKKISTTVEDSEMSFNNFEQMKKLFPNMESIAKLDSEEFLITIKNMGICWNTRMQDIDFDGAEYAIFNKDVGKDLEFSMNLGINDDVIATFKPHRKVPVSVKVTIDNFRRGMNAIRPLALRASKHLYIHSKDNFPIIFTCHNTPPEESSAFKKDIEIWYCIAPTIAEDE